MEEGYCKDKVRERRRKGEKSGVRGSGASEGEKKRDARDEDGNWGGVKR